jgi:hypothetical protein
MVVMDVEEAQVVSKGEAVLAQEIRKTTTCARAESKMASPLGCVAKTGWRVRKRLEERSLCGEPEQLIDDGVLGEDIPLG